MSWDTDDGTRAAGSLLCERLQEAADLLRDQGQAYWADALQEGRMLVAGDDPAGLQRVKGTFLDVGDIRALVTETLGADNASRVAVRERLGWLQRDILRLTWSLNRSSLESQAEPGVWPPPILGQRPSPVPADDFPVTDDPAKIAAHRVTLGWTFVTLGVFAPPVFLPYAFFYGWQSWRAGEAVQAARILVAATALTLLAGVGAAAAYLYNVTAASSP